jgi:hypothetical protein
MYPKPRARNRNRNRNGTCAPEAEATSSGCSGAAAKGRELHGYLRGSASFLRQARRRHRDLLDGARCKAARLGWGAADVGALERAVERKIRILEEHHEVFYEELLLCCRLLAVEAHAGGDGDGEDPEESEESEESDNDA